MSARPTADAGDVPSLPWFVRADDLGCTLAATVGRALRGFDCADLADLAGRDRPKEFSPLARGGGRLRAVAAHKLTMIDAAAVANWVVAQYDGPEAYPGVVIGSANGALAHLAVAMGVPFLPTSFEVYVRWADGSPTDVDRAMAYGHAVGRVIAATNPALHVRQVHDPVTLGASSGWRITLHLRWRALPVAYQEFLGGRMRPRPFMIAVRDERQWPVVRDGEYSFQIGTVGSDLSFHEYLGTRELASLLPDGPRAPSPGRDRAARLELGERAVEPEVLTELRQWAATAGSRYCSVGYHDARQLSGIAADLIRDWLRAGGKAADRAVVTTGRILDPAQVLRRSLVPYWCENATAAAVSGAELWLAASEPFASVHLLPEPPGTAWSKLATMVQWESAALFATHCGVVDPVMKASYPHRILAPRHATSALQDLTADPAPRALSYSDFARGIMTATGHDLEVDPIG
jgi:hypothetical protein